MKTLKQIVEQQMTEAHGSDRARQRGVRLSSAFIRKMDNTIDYINKKHGPKERGGTGELQRRYIDGTPFHWELPRNMVEPGFTGYIVIRFTRKGEPYPIMIWTTTYGKDEKTGQQMEPEFNSKDFAQEMKKLERKHSR